MSKSQMHILSLVLVCSVLLVTALAQGTSLSNRGCKSFSANNTCQQCSQRFFNDTAGICQPINPQCRTYNSTNGNCLTCYTGFRLVETTCLLESIFGGASVSDVNCRRFENNVCAECSERFFFNANRVCQQVDPNCQDYNRQTGGCTSCYTGFQLTNQSQCVRRQQNQTSSFCRRFQNNTCVQCSQGYYFNSSRQCTKIDDNCKNFNLNTQTCQQCYEGWRLNNQSVCERIPLNQTGNLCRRFDQGRCAECAERAFFNQNGTCEAVNANCRTFQVSSGQAPCTSCYEGFQLQSGNCVGGSSANLDPFCRTFNNGTCTQCSFRYFRNQNGRCELISPLCREYNDNNGQCISCYLGYRVINAQCFEDPNIMQDNLCAEFQNQICVRCARASYLNNQTNLCTAVNPNCRTFNETNGSCLTCYTAWVLSNGTCLQDNNFQLRDPFCAQFDNQTCTRCSNRYYFGPNRQCMQASDFCQTYNQTNGNCLTCYLGYRFQNNTCNQIPVNNIVLSDLNCAEFNTNGTCRRCSTRFFFNTNRTCQSISPLCKQYNQNNGLCTTCYTGFQLQNGSCTLSNSTTDSLCRTFAGNQCIQCSVGSAFDNFGVCRTSDSYCQTFDSTGRICTQCFRGYTQVNGVCQLNTAVIPLCRVASQDNSRCVECAQGSFLVIQTGRCQQIDPNCANFNVGTQTCSGCFQGFNLVNGNCITVQSPQLRTTDPNCQQFNASNVCIACFSRYFINSQNLCERVSDFCNGYNFNTGACTSCFSGFTLNNGTCTRNS